MENLNNIVLILTELQKDFEKRIDNIQKDKKAKYASIVEKRKLQHFVSQIKAFIELIEFQKLQALSYEELVRTPYVTEKVSEIKSNYWKEKKRINNEYVVEKEKRRSGHPYSSSYFLLLKEIEKVKSIIACPCSLEEENYLKRLARNHTINQKISGSLLFKKDLEPYFLPQLTGKQQDAFSLIQKKSKEVMGTYYFNDVLTLFNENPFLCECFENQQSVYRLILNQIFIQKNISKDLRTFLFKVFDSSKNGMEEVFNFLTSYLDEKQKSETNYQTLIEKEDLEYEKKISVWSKEELVRNQINQEIMARFGTFTTFKANILEVVKEQYHPNFISTYGAYCKFFEQYEKAVQFEESIHKVDILTNYLDVEKNEFTHLAQELLQEEERYSNYQQKSTFSKYMYFIKRNIQRVFNKMGLSNAPKTYSSMKTVWEEHLDRKRELLMKINPVFDYLHKELKSMCFSPKYKFVIKDNYPMILTDGFSINQEIPSQLSYFVSSFSSTLTDIQLDSTNSYLCYSDTENLGKETMNLLSKVSNLDVSNVIQISREHISSIQTLYHLMIQMYYDFYKVNDTSFVEVLSLEQKEKMIQLLSYFYSPNPDLASKSSKTKDWARSKVFTGSQTE